MKRRHPQHNPPQPEERKQEQIPEDWETCDQYVWRTMIESSGWFSNMIREDYRRDNPDRPPTIH